MGVLRPDNGGAPPPDDGAPHGVPDLPPEWGTIVIPDNAAELDADATQIRRELRRAARGLRLRRFFGLPTNPGQTAGLGVPLIIMSVAIITTLISLFVVTWDRRPATVPTDQSTASTAGTPLSALSFTGSNGDTVSLGALLPAVVLLVDACPCAPLIRDVAATAPAGVSVVVVGRQLPEIHGTPANTHALADPLNVLRGRYAPTAAATHAAGSNGGAGSKVIPGASPGTAGSGGTPASPAGATALFVDRSGTLLTTVPHATAIAQLRAPLAALAAASPASPTR